MATTTPVKQKGINEAVGTPFETALLDLIGAPHTAQNFQFLNAWQLREHGNYSLYANNPFFTTAGGGGAARDLPAGTFPTIPNTPGVTIFPDVTTGTVATERTLEQYPTIAAALISGSPSSWAGNSAFQNELSKWSGAGYSALNVAKAPTTPQGPGLNVPIEGASAADWTSAGIAGGTLGSVGGTILKIGGQSANPLAEGLTGAGLLFGAGGPQSGIAKWLGIPQLPKNSIMRGAEILGGAVLILLGVIMIGGAASKATPVAQVATAAKAIR